MPPLDTAPPVSLLKLAVPADHVLLLTLNRPHVLNAVSPELTRDVEHVLAWFDSEPDLWVAIITGAGRAFCAGADLKAFHAVDHGALPAHLAAATHGFAGVSRRTVTAKPLIAAVNGVAHGGGLELVLNCDLVVASARATFAFPEVRRGLIAAQGGIPRIAAVAGHQLAAELLFTGQPITAQDAYTRFQFVNAVVAPSTVLCTAVAWACAIAQNSPDAMAATKRALILAQQHQAATIAGMCSDEARAAFTGENIKEGRRAFVEKRAPVWKNPAKL